MAAMLLMVSCRVCYPTVERQVVRDTVWVAVPADTLHIETTDTIIEVREAGIVGRIEWSQGRLTADLVREELRVPTAIVSITETPVIMDDRRKKRDWYSILLSFVLGFSAASVIFAAVSTRRN